jgi:hypothetical protein
LGGALVARAGRVVMVVGGGPDNAGGRGLVRGGGPTPRLFPNVNSGYILRQGSYWSPSSCFGNGRQFGWMFEFMVVIAEVFPFKRRDRRKSYRK